MPEHRDAPPSRKSRQSLPDLPGDRSSNRNQHSDIATDPTGRDRERFPGETSPYRRTRQRNGRANISSPGKGRTQRSERRTFSVVLPQPRQMLSQTMPDLLVCVAAVIILLIGPVAPLGVPIWTMGLLIPSLLTFLLADPVRRPLWRRTAVINLLVLGLVFPVLVVRQSVVQIPYLDRSNGTLWPPLLATVAVAVVLLGLAFASSILSNEDPEYAGVLFLPSAMLVALLAGPTDVTGFRTAVTGIALIYFFVAILTVIASMLPGAYPTLVAPVAIAIEFIALPANRAGSMFPIGSGMVSKFLFFGIVFVAVALAIAVPTLSLWVRETRRLMSQPPKIGPI